MTKIKVVIFGWGIEFGKYFCGGAPAGLHRVWMVDRWVTKAMPAVPVSWSYGFGVHWRTYHHGEWVDRTAVKCCAGWWWHSRMWYGREHECTGPALAEYLQGVAELRAKD